jgi:type II secretory pathway pseudopilin PulG
MSASIRSTRKSLGNAGFTLLELLMATALTIIAMVAVMGLFHASARFMRSQELDMETAQAARSSIDAMVRDLRLGGACLPTIGPFIALSGTDGGTQDSITTRTGLTRPDMTCVTAAVQSPVAVGDTSIPVDSVNGFTVGVRGYICDNNCGTSELFTITGLNSDTNTLTRDTGSASAYATDSTVYLVDERVYYIDQTTTPWGSVPELVMQIDNQAPQSFAIGIETLDVTYQLNRNCPACDTVSLPASDDEWRLVQELFLTVTARSDRPNQSGQYYRRTLKVSVKPRNLLPS